MRKKNKRTSEGLCISKERGSKKCCEEMLQPKMLPEFEMLMKPPPSAAAALSVAFSLTASLIPQPFEVLFHVFVIYFCSKQSLLFWRLASPWQKAGSSAPSAGTTEKLHQGEREENAVSRCLVQQIFIKVYPLSVVIKLKCSSESPGELVTTRFLGFTLRVSDSVGLKQSSKFAFPASSPVMLVI